jgi:hypothetical protein
MSPSRMVQWVVTRKSATDLTQIKVRGTPAAARLFFRARRQSMATVRSHPEPSDVIAEQGLVLVEGPDGVAVTLTPDAAEETGRRMIIAASEARRQEGG